MSVCSVRDPSRFGAELFEQTEQESVRAESVSVTAVASVSCVLVSGGRDRQADR